MRIAPVFAALVLTALPGLAAAACSSHSVQMSCAEGQIYDSQTRSCVPVVSS